MCSKLKRSFLSHHQRSPFFASSEVCSRAFSPVYPVRRSWSTTHLASSRKSCVLSSRACSLNRALRKSIVRVVTRSTTTSSVACKATSPAVSSRTPPHTSGPANSNSPASQIPRRSTDAGSAYAPAQVSVPPSRHVCRARTGTSSGSAPTRRRRSGLRSAA